MKAVVWTAYGEPDVLKVKDISKPIPMDDEVLIKIHYSAVTTGDSRLRGCRIPIGFWLPVRLMYGLWKPRISVPGMDFAGEVESVGKNVAQFRTGDRVCGTKGTHLGANAEYTCLSENGDLIKIPETVSYEHAAAIIFGGLTTVHFLRDKVKMHRGDKVLVNGASGAVGTAAVQLAKYFGAESTGICSEPNHKLVKSLGADKLIDYAKEDFSTNGERYNIIFDTVGNLSFRKCRKSLSKHGKLISTNTGLFGIIHSIFNRKIVCGVAEASKEKLKFLIELVDSGKMTPVIEGIYPIEDIVEVHRRIDQGHKKGNILLDLSM